jgi:hypothetical protein
MNKTTNKFSPEVRARAGRGGWFWIMRASTPSGGRRRHQLPARLVVRPIRNEVEASFYKPVIACERLVYGVFPSVPPLRVTHRLRCDAVR